jgi:hypothetical protein
VVAEDALQVLPVLLQPVQVYEVGEPEQLEVSVTGVLITGAELLDVSVHDTAEPAGGGPAALFQLTVTEAGAPAPAELVAVTE